MKHRLNPWCVVYALSVVIVVVAAIILVQEVVFPDDGDKEPSEQTRAIYRSARRLLHRRGSTYDWQPAIENAQQVIEELEAEFPSLKEYSSR